MSRFFQKLSTKFLVLLFLSAMLPVSIVGLYGILSSSKAFTELALTKIDNESASSAQNIANFLDNFRNEVLFLTKVPPVQGIVRARAGGGIDRKDNSTYEAWVNRLNIIFGGIMQDKPYYLKLRYIDENGNEMVRLDAVNKSIRILPKKELQNVKNTDYFIQTLKLGNKKFYVSPVTQNRESDGVNKSSQLVIRCSTPVFNTAGQVKGVLVADVSAQAFLKDIESVNSSKSQQAFLVNQEGYYLSHPNQQKEQGFELNNAKLDQDYPRKFVEQILTEKQGHIYENTDRIISYQSVPLNQGDDNRLVVIHQSPKDVVFNSVSSFRNVAIAMMLLSSGVALGVGIYLVSRTTKMVDRTITEIVTSSTEIATTAEQQERIARQQATSVNETSTTMEQLGASSQQSDEQAESATVAARQALSFAEEGTQAVSLSLNGMTQLHEKVSEIADEITRLSQQTNQIGNISALVSNLANEINMLALNASVEAARAGHHGKGFGVVASEIRKLADQSKKSAESIKGIVGDIQNAINSTVIVTSEGTRTVDEGMQIAQKTADTFVGVADAIKDVVLNNQQISLNIKQQALAITQVVAAMHNLNLEAKESAAGITQTKLGTQKLNEAAKELKAVI